MIAVRARQLIITHGREIRVSRHPGARAEVGSLASRAATRTLGRFFRLVSFGSRIIRAGCNKTRGRKVGRQSRPNAGRRRVRAINRVSCTASRATGHCLSLIRALFAETPTQSARRHLRKKRNSLCTLSPKNVRPR